MRKLTAGLFSSVDGVVDHMENWQFDSFDAEMAAQMGQLIERVDAGILGRVGYQEWAQGWPHAGNENPFAPFINNLPKYVASRTLTGELESQNSTLIQGDLLDFVKDLKSQSGGDISLFAGVSLVRQLLFAGLLDELTLMIHPVIAGEGRRLFEPGDPVTRLKLVDSSPTSAGNSVVTYAMR